MNTKLVRHRFGAIRLALSFLAFGALVNAGQGSDRAVMKLAEEVAEKGWIVFSSRSARGNWDLMICRPDGSQLHSVTQTADYHEFAPQFSRDGSRLLYRRVPIDTTIDGNAYGTQGSAVISRSDGTNPEVLGTDGEYAWASWTPDGDKVLCLSLQGVFEVDLATRKITRRLPRKGFYQQVSCSPDGNWMCGVSNSFGTGWSVAVMDLRTGTPHAVSRVDCCTPDWFPNGESLIYSSRPPGQSGNDGQGWTQLWMSDAAGKIRSLVFGEDGRHIYGGHVSPDGKYVLFTGNAQEDGDPENVGAPMGLIRLAAAPIIAGQSEELRTLHPHARHGPVLDLPVGYEPCWTLSDLPARAFTHTSAKVTAENAPDAVAAVGELAIELKDKGWIAFSAPRERGDWDLFRIRPDGSDMAPITDTPEFNEAGVRFSPDGTQILYYRMPRDEAVDNNNYGTFELVISDSAGRHPVSYGDGYPWASWGPDGKQIVCLEKKGIRTVDLTSRKTLGTIGRHGVVQQLAWSPDGKRFVGTANGLGEFWNIGVVNLNDDSIHAVSETDRYNCTPDWMPDSQGVIYSRGIVPQVGGWAELWTSDGEQKTMLYAADGLHVYGGCASPDGKYIVFTLSSHDLGGRDSGGTQMSIIRRADAPMISPGSATLWNQYPSACTGPRLDLTWGWEPHWTFASLESARP